MNSIERQVRWVKIRQVFVDARLLPPEDGIILTKSKIQNEAEKQVKECILNRIWKPIVIQIWVIQYQIEDSVRVSLLDFSQY